MKKTLKVTYTYVVKYGHKDHLKRFKKELKESPLYGSFGAGVASDGEVYSYSCDLKERSGVIVEKRSKK